MNLTDQKLGEILKQIIDTYGAKGSITTNTLCDIMEKYETTPPRWTTSINRLPRQAFRL